MPQDVVGAAGRAADNTTAHDLMHDKSSPCVGPVLLACEPGAQTDTPTSTDKAKNPVEICNSPPKKLEGSSSPSSTVKESDRMDVEDRRTVEDRLSTQSDDFEEDGASANASDVAVVPVDPPVKYHANWDAWQTYFVDYCCRTMQVIPVKETMSRAERNKRLKKTKKGVDESQLVPERFDPYQRVYICTHGWKKRKSRSEGSRPRQHIRLTNCPFRFVVQWNLARAELQVKNGVFSHNHQVSPAAFATYPVSRGVFDPLVGARVQGMLEVGAKRSRIYDYLLDHDENIVQADVDNLVRDYSSSTTNVDDNEATARELALFAAADPENLSTVADTDCGETGVISLASAHMRRVFGRFSEVLLVGCSHKTNRYNYQLLTFMGMNEFGEGAVVQQSLIEANGDWHMERAIAHFKRFHPTRINLLRVIVVDKDLNEIRVLEANFPEARILICHFYVIKYLKEMRSKPEYGKISSEDAGQIDAAVHKMVYAVSEEKYNEAHESLRGICERCDMEGFFTYFEKNWHSSTDRWVYYLRASLPHFNNHTNNRLESYFGKLKEGVDSSMSMAKCIKALVSFDRRKQNDYDYRLTRIGQFRNCNYDEEMSTVLRFTTHYVARQIERQYTVGLEKESRYNFEEDEGDKSIVRVRGLFKEHTLHVDDWRCDCEFAASMSLPCRHAIAYRKHSNVSGTAIPWNRIDERWTNPTMELKKVRQFTYEKFVDASPGSARKKVRINSERYREAVRATHLIASEMADIEDDVEFDNMLQFVMNQWRNVRQKKIAEEKPKRLQDENSSEEEDSRTQDALVKQEFGISSSEEEEIFEESLSERETSSEKKTPANPVAIRLNPKARKVGAPKKQKKKTIAGERVDRKWYEAAEEGRKKAGEVTLLAVVDALDRVQPDLHEVQRRLSGIIVKFGEAETKKPKLKVMKNPVLIQDPFYLIPAKLLDACLKVLPLSNTKEDAISVDDSQGSQPSEQKPDKFIETVIVKDVGSFSRKQIETFKRVENLKRAVDLGLDMHKWLLEEGIPSLPAEYHEIGTQVAAKMLASYPYKRIDGLPDIPDYNYAMLYRMAPSVWLTDAAIRALCLRLSVTYPTARFAGFQKAVEKKRRSRNTQESPVDEDIRKLVLQQVSESGVETIMLSLNFDNFHWCCVVVKVSAKRIYYYDPLNQASYKNAANAVGTHLKITGLHDYQVIPQNNPLQFDGHSCGVYVCWMFIRQVLPGRHLDINESSLKKRRLELFYYLLSGRLLPADTTKSADSTEIDDMEEKSPAPSVGEEDKEEDDVPPTQAAQ